MIANNFDAFRLTEFSKVTRLCFLVSAITKSASNIGDQVRVHGSQEIVVDEL